MKRLLLVIVAILIAATVIPSLVAAQTGKGPCRNNLTCRREWRAAMDFEHTA